MGYQGFPTIRVTGGPHGKDVEVAVDGEMVPKVTHVDISADVNDAIVVTTRQLMIIDVEVQGMDERVYEAAMSFGGVVFRSRADTIWEAVADVSRQLELTLGSQRDQGAI